MRRALIKSVPAIIGLCIVIFIGSLLSTSTYHKKLTPYGLPICSIDRHRFETDTCEACGEPVVKTGVFFSAAVAQLDPYGTDYQLSFTDFYQSYEEFQQDYNLCLSYSNAVLAVIVLEVVTYGLLLFRSYRAGREPMRLGGRLK